jgi:hypothetical protein
MNILSTDKFKSFKSSDTLVILGSGYSINNINDSQWNAIKGFNSMSFNWFCFHSFAPTFFLIREQANIDSRNKGNESRNNFFKCLSKKSYRDTCLIVHDMRLHSKHVYNYAKHSKLFSQNGITVLDQKWPVRRRIFTFDIFTKGVLHGKCTMTNVLHIALYLQYKQIIFAGVDLNDSRYFWMRKNETRYTIRRRKRRHTDTHPVSRFVIHVIKTVRKHFAVEMYTLNSKSLLASFLPHIQL